MTLKKSMISIAAAGVIAATITGCGSSGGSSSNGGGSTAQPTSLTAIDGYVIGAKIQVGYDDGNTSTAVQTTDIDNSANYALTADENGLIKAGSYTYDIKEVNSTVLDNIRYIKLTKQNGGNAADGSVVYAPTFIDHSDSNFTYDTASGDQEVNANFELIAPAGFKVITPISTLVYKSVVNSIDANESNASELIADALADIAAALGVSANDIKDLDPISAIQTKPEYALINAFLKDVVELGANAEDVAELLKAQPAVTGTTTAAKISSAFANLETAAAGQGITLFTTAKAAFAGTDGNNYVEALKTGAYNVDKTREASKGGDFSLVTNTLVLSDINVTAIEVDNGTDISSIASKGDKVNQNNVAFELALESNTDENSTKNATFVTKISLERAYEIGDKNVTDLTISLPITIGAMTTGDVNVTSGANVSYAGRADDGSLISGDLNASYILANNTAGTFFAQVTNNELELNASALIDAVEANLSKASIDGDVIANLQVALVDTDSALTRVESVNIGSATTIANAYWSPLTVNSYNAASTFAGKKLLDLTAADMRTAVTSQNVAPNNTLTVSGTLPFDAAAMTGAGTTVAPYVIANHTALTLDFSASTTDTSEANTTATVTASSSAFDLNTTDMLKVLKGAYASNNPAAAAGSEFNLTSAITTTGDINYTITTVVSDEFGESNTTKYYFMLDRPAYVNSAANRAWGLGALDDNTSQLLADYDTNTTLKTLTNGSYVVILENNNSDASTDYIELTLGQESVDLNLSNNSTELYTLTLQADGSIELNNTTVPADINFTVIEIGATDAHGVDFNKSLNDANITY